MLPRKRLTTGFNPFTGETIFKLEGVAASEVYLIGHFNSGVLTTISMRLDGSVWMARLRLSSGSHAFALQIDGVMQPWNTIAVQVDYRQLPGEVLRVVAESHTCFCHAHKWN